VELFNYVALPSNHPPFPLLKLNLNSKKRKKKRKKKKEKNKNQNMDYYKSRLRMYVPFVEQEIPNNLI
jgi:hypothetical protein